MYFYEVEVYHPLLGSEKIILRHNNRFDNHQLNVIVQETFDECIEKYCVAQLNRLSQDNEKLELKIIELESKLKVIELFIKLKTKEIEEEVFSNYKKHTKTLENMESMEAVTAIVDIYILMNLIRILNELFEIIESGKFDIVEKSKKGG